MVKIRPRRTVGQMRGKFLRRRLKRSTQFYGKKIKQPVQYFTRTQFISGQFVIAPGAAAAGQAINFQFANVPAATDFTGLYDQYCIKGVKMTFIPRITGTVVTDATSVAAVGSLWTCIDYDDDSTPPNLATLLQYQNLKRTRVGAVHSRYLVPKSNSQVSATVGNAPAPKAKVWLDVGSTNVPHYGLKLWYDSTAVGTPTITYDATIKYYLAFKNVR